jgi:hypothetical protein
MSDTNNNHAPAPTPAPGQEPDLDLADIEARLKAATPGPWGYKAGFLKHYVFSLDAQEDFGISLQELHWNDGHEVPAAANAQFIANAPTDIAALIAEVRRLRREVNKMVRDSYNSDNGEVGYEQPWRKLSLPYPDEEE